MNDLQQELAAFEAAMRDQLKWSLHDLERGPDGEYIKHITAGAWTGWTVHSRAVSPDKEYDAVQTLIEDGWTWDGDQWQRPFIPTATEIEYFASRYPNLRKALKADRAALQEPHPEDIEGNLRAAQ